MTDRITGMADTIRTHRWLPMNRRCACGMVINQGSHADHIIDALLAQHFTREIDYGTSYPKIPVTDQQYFRYVTEWEPAP